jgi:hypothetical protein
MEWDSLGIMLKGVRKRAEQAGFRHTGLLFLLTLFSLPGSPSMSVNFYTGASSPGGHKDGSNIHRTMHQTTSHYHNLLQTSLPGSSFQRCKRDMSAWCALPRLRGGIDIISDDDSWEPEHMKYHPDLVRLHLADGRK